MANPDKYIKGYSFSDYQEANPTQPLPAPEVDAELIDIQTSIGTIVDSIMDVRRSDGALKNTCVTADSLAADVRSLMMGNFNPRGSWTQAVAYAVKDTVVKEGATYMCALPHTSSASFPNDLAAGKWLLVASPFNLSSDYFSQVFSGNGVQTTFTLSQPFTSISELAVYVQDGSAGFQRLRSSGASPQVSLPTPNQISISSAPANGTNNIFVEAVNQTAAAASASAAASAVSAENSNLAAGTQAQNSLSYAQTAELAAIRANTYANTIQWRVAAPVSSSFTVTQNDSGKMFVVDTSAGNVTVTLPLLSTLQLPFIVGVKKATGDANQIIISPASGNTVDSGSTKSIANLSQSASLIATDTSNWISLDAGNPIAGSAQTVNYCGVTTSSGQVWSVTNPNIIALYDGLTILVRFNANASNQNRLDLNGFGAKYIVPDKSSLIISAAITPVTSVYMLTYYDGYWRMTDLVGNSNITMLKRRINEAMSDNVASAATVDIWTSQGNSMHITGTASISSLGTPPQAGAKRLVVFDDAATLVHSANLLLPAGQNITTAAGDSAVFLAESTSVVRCVNYQKALDSNPAGAVITYATQTPPIGYVKCNGAALSRTAYAQLFAAIGTTWGAGDGSTTFNVPDFRGEFLRIWDDGKGVDVYYEDLAQGGVASALNTTGSQVPDLAVDGSKDSYWESGLNSGWFQYALPEAKIISEVHLEWNFSYNSFSTTPFVIGASLDGVSFTNFASILPSQVSSSVTFSTGLSTAYRYFRVNFGALVTTLKIYEFNLISAVQSRSFASYQQGSLSGAVGWGLTGNNIDTAPAFLSKSSGLDVSSAQDYGKAYILNSNIFGGTSVGIPTNLTSGKAYSVRPRNRALLAAIKY